MIIYYFSKNASTLLRLALNFSNFYFKLEISFSSSKIDPII